MTLWKVLSQLPQGLRGLLQIFLTQRDPMRRLTPVCPPVMGITSQGTLSAGIHLDDPGPHGRVFA